MPLKYGGIGLFWLGIAAFVFASSVSKNGLLRRFGSRYVSSLDIDLRAMFMPQRGEELAWFQVTAVMASLMAFGLLRQQVFLGVAAMITFGPRVFVTVMVRKRRARLDEQAHGFALALANTLKTTASVGDALRLTLDVTSKPMKDEIQTALSEVRVGSTLEEALLAAAARAGAPALDVVVSALLIGQKTGGDLPSILEGTAGSLRELKRLEELTDRVTRSAKQSLAVAACITAGLAIMLPRVMPGFFDPLATTMKGRLIAVQCAGVYALAVFLGWRFTRKSI